MQIGTLGEVVFSVSDRVVETINNFTWSGSARYSTHQRHLCLLYTSDAADD